jgi:competence protein ComEA
MARTSASGGAQATPDREANGSPIGGASDGPLGPADAGSSGTNGSAVEQPQPPSEAEDAAAADGTCRLWLTRGDRIVVGVLAAGLLVLMLVHWVRLSGWGMRPVEIDRMEPRALDYKIDINEATWVEWAQLDGIGEVLADRIVTDRTQNGPFRSVEDLRRVKGIGAKTLEKIRPWLEVGGAGKE